MGLAIVVMHVLNYRFHIVNLQLFTKGGNLLFLSNGGTMHDIKVVSIIHFVFIACLTRNARQTCPPKRVKLKKRIVYSCAPIYAHTNHSSRNNNPVAGHQIV
jgi:hypothetical protein